MSARFPALFQPQHPYHRAFFNWNAWLAFHGSAGLARPRLPFAHPLPPSPNTHHHPPPPLPQRGPVDLSPSSSGSSSSSSRKKNSAFSVDSLLDHVVTRNQTLAKGPSEADGEGSEGVGELVVKDSDSSALYALRPLARDHYVLIEDSSGEEEQNRLTEMSVSVWGQEFGGTFCKSGHTIEPESTLHLPSGWRVRRGEPAEAANVRRSGEGFESLRRIGSREELQLLVEKGPSTPQIEPLPTPSVAKSETDSASPPETPTEFPPVEEGTEKGKKGAGFGCTRCGKVFSYRYYRDKHLKYTRCVDLGDRKFPCTLCPRSFEKRDRLRIHVLHVHEKHRPHSCAVCGKRFSQSSSLNKHLRVHSGERPYKCLHCPKAFTASSILRTHVRQHSGEKPFQCRHCGKAFASHAAHDSHVRRTHVTPKAESHPCMWCDKTFQHSSHLKFHVQCSHSAVTPFSPPTA